MRFYRIEGCSMLPSYKDGDLLVGKAFDGALEKGRCYGFRYGGKSLFHRFVGMHEREAVFTGDFSPHFEQVRPENVFFTVEEAGQECYINCIKAVNGLFFLLRRFPWAGRLKMAALKRLLPLLKGENE